MSIEDLHSKYWWNAKIDLADPRWLCPAWAGGCGRVSLVADWEETETFCEDCGSHDARRCPECGEAFDHVWGSYQLLTPIEAREL